MPWDDVRMPIDVDDWLMPVFMCLTQIQNEASRSAASSSSSSVQYQPGKWSQHRDDLG